MEATNHSHGNGPTPTAERGTGHRMGGTNRLLWVGIAVLLAFLAGFGWQYLRAASIQQRLAQTEHELMIERLRLELAHVAIDAQTGEFEAARGRMSALFARMQEQREALPGGVRRVVDDLLSRRDDIITGLSRGTPETAGTLFGYLDQLDTLTSGPAAAPAPADTGP